MTNPDVIVRKMERDARRARSERDAGFEKAQPHLQATITSRDGSVRTRWDPNVLWIHLNNVEIDLSTAYNDGIVTGDDEALVGLGVLVAPSPKSPYPYQIVRKNPTQFVMGGQSSQTGNYDMPHHGENHQIPAEDNKGSDPVYVYQPALRMLKTEGDGSTLVVTVYGYHYNHNGTTRTFSAQQVDLSSHVPGSGLERRVLLYLDKALNFIQVVVGDTVSSSGATPAPYPAVPANARASAYVSLENGQTAVTTATHVEDARDFLAMGQDLALGGLIDVDLTGLTDGQIISYDADNNVWVPGHHGYPFDVITVDEDDPDADYSTLENAIDAATSFAIIHVGPGIYTLNEKAVSSADVSAIIGTGLNHTTIQTDDETASFVMSGGPNLIAECTVRCSSNNAGDNVRVISSPPLVFGLYNCQLDAANNSGGGTADAHCLTGATLVDVYGFTWFSTNVPAGDNAVTDSTGTTFDFIGIGYVDSQALGTDNFDGVYFLKGFGLYAEGVNVRGPARLEAEVVAASGASYAINMDVANVFDVTLDQDCTFSVTNEPPSGTQGSFKLILHPAGFTPTMPAGWIWTGSSTIDSTAGTHTIIEVFTVDGGTTTFATLVGTGLS